MSNGFQGVAYHLGPQGSPGLVGYVGIQGSRVQGIQGFSGQQGVQGFSGIQGTQGVDPVPNGFIQVWDEEELWNPTLWSWLRVAIPRKDRKLRMENWKMIRETITNGSLELRTSDFDLEVE